VLVSALAHSVILTAALSRFQITSAEKVSPFVPPTVHAVLVTPLLFPIKLTSQAVRDRIGRVTGLPTALPTAVSHPSLPRTTTVKQLDEVDSLGDWPKSFLRPDNLQLPSPQSRLPVDAGLLTTVSYYAGRMPRTLKVQVGGFSNPVLLSDYDPTGLTSKRHQGIDTTEFGDGFGNGGGRVLLPVTIIWKPTPSYTADARSRQIEGEVIVNVLFQADGRVEILGIVQQLGYGLDEVAVEAIRQIKFRPALVNGLAVDFQARAHVEFHLFTPSLATFDE
jgi:TonB family protein